MNLNLAKSSNEVTRTYTLPFANLDMILGNRLFARVCGSFEGSFKIWVFTQSKSKEIRNFRICVYVH